MGRTKKLTISLPDDLIEMADRIADEKKISRSRVISQCLTEVQDKRKAELLKEGYLAMADENKEIAKMALRAQSDIIPDWK